MDGIKVERTYGVSSQDAFDACLQAAANLGLSVLMASKDALILDFRTRSSDETTGRQRFSASVVDEGGSCRVVIERRSTNSGKTTLVGASKSGPSGEIWALAHQVHEELERLLSSALANGSGNVGIADEAKPLQRPAGTKGQSAPPPPVGFTGRQAPPSPQMASTRRGSSEDPISALKPDDDTQEDLEVVVDVGSGVADDPHGATAPAQEDLGEKDPGLHVASIPEIDDIEVDAESDDGSLVGRAESVQIDELDGREAVVRLDIGAEWMGSMSDPPQEPLSGPIPLSPPEPLVSPPTFAVWRPEQNSDPASAVLDSVEAPTRPASIAGRQSSTERTPRRSRFAFVGVLFVGFAFIAGLLVNRSGGSDSQTLVEATGDSQQLITVSTPITTTTSEPEEEQESPMVVPAPTVSSNDDEQSVSTSVDASSSLPVTTSSEATEGPSTTTTIADWFDPSLPWIVLSASGSDQGSGIVIGSKVGERHHGDCHTYTWDYTVSDPDGVAKVEWLMIYVEGQIPTGTPDADCTSQTYELVDGTERSGTWRLTYHVSPFVQCAKYTQAVKATDNRGNTTVQTIGGFWFGGSDPPATCNVEHRYEAG